MSLAYSWWRVPVLNRLRMRTLRLLGLFPARIVPGAEIGRDVEIRGLACPLRYDLVVRTDFFRYLAEEIDLYERARSFFLQAEPVRAYQVWFREIVVPRYAPHLGRDESALELAFEQRVAHSVALWRSMGRDGLAAANPIRLLSGDAIRPVGGKRIASSLFAGDGCHRLAILWINGQTVLRPDQYEVAVFRTYTPVDNTRILRAKLPLSTAEYCRFLSARYFEGRERASLEELLEEMGKHDSDEMAELRSVLRADFPECREL